MTALGTFTRIGSCGTAILATLAIALVASPSNHIARLRGTWKLENDVRTSVGSLGTVVETLALTPTPPATRRGPSRSRFTAERSAGENFRHVALAKPILAPEPTPSHRPNTSPPPSTLPYKRVGETCSNYETRSLLRTSPLQSTKPTIHTETCRRS